MKVKKTDWHYRIYEWTFTVWGGHALAPADSCTYLQRIIFRAPLACAAICLLLAGLLMMLAAFSAFYIMLCPVMFLFGYLPDKGIWGEYIGFVENENDGELPWSYCVYDVRRINGIPMYPWIFVLAGAAACFLWSDPSKFGLLEYIDVGFIAAHPVLSSLSFGAASLFLIFASLQAFALAWKTLKELAGRASVRLTAQKQKICAEIQIVS